jgi:LPXTG-motif cell wall-anchored protein
MKAVSTLGFVLIALGILSLAYFEDPVRLMLRDFQPHKTNLVPPILGALALIGGIALLFAGRRKG